MRKVRAKFRRTVKEFLAIAILVGALGAINLISQIAPHLYPWLGAAVMIGFCLWVAFKLKLKSEKHINRNGYVVLARENELEHRFIAIRMLNRNLKQNEIVHHINGKKTDNEIRNLCLMDREKHELFHSWLSWKKKKSGKYPPFKDQKRILVEEYNGILIESLVPEKREDSEKNEPDISGKLFDLLREERRRLAIEKKLPAYMVFDDKTLHEMVEIMPDTDELMLQVRGVGSTKLRMYGACFITVIKKFKSEFDIIKRKKDSA